MKICANRYGFVLQLVMAPKPKGRGGKRKERGSDGTTPKPQDKRSNPETKAPKNSNSWDALQAMLGQIDERTIAEPGLNGAGPTETTTSENSKPAPVVTETATPEQIEPAPGSPIGSDMSGFSQEEVAKAEENVAIHKENSQEEMLHILRSLQTDVAEIKATKEGP